MGLKKLIDLDLLDRFLEKVRALIPSTYASSKSAGGYADKALSVPIATVDSTSTATVFTVQVPEFANETGPRDGLFFYIYNNKIASASGWTLNVNGWGAKPVYNVNAERTTTGFAKTRIFPIWYDSTLISDGCWVIGYLTDANTTYSSFINLNHNTGAGRLADSVIYRYQLLFEKDEDYLTPLNNVSNGYNKTNKAMLTNVEFDPFGEIVYWYSSGTVAAGDRARGDYLNYTFGTLDLRYTFNCGSTLTAYKPFYLVVDIGSNGKAKIASSTPWAQELPSTNDGHYYIFLGRTYSAYQLSLYPWHPVYYHDGTTIRQYLSVDVKSVNGHTVGTDVPANAVFTDTTYESKAAASGGTAVSLVTTGEKYTWNNKGTYSKPSGGIPDSDIASAATWNAKGNGTITGITMNGASKGTSGVVDLGTVITAHQDISGKADKSATVSNVAYDSTNKKLTKTINGTTSDVVTAATLKTAMALNNVENKSSATIRGELTKANVTTALGYTPPTTDTTYESKAAASGGTAVSLVTTGEKYTWNSKQAALVSGTNIKTVNGYSLLGSGDLEISGGSLVVTFSNTSPYTPDKTFSEVLSAIQDGIIPTAVKGTDVFELKEYSSTFNYIRFSKCVVETYSVRETEISFTPNGVSVSSREQPDASYENLNLYRLVEGEPDFSYQDLPTGTLGVQNTDTQDITDVFLWGGGSASRGYVGVRVLNGNCIEGERYDLYSLASTVWDTTTPLITAVFQTVGARNGTPVTKKITVSGTPWTYDFTSYTVTYSEEEIGGGGSMFIQITGQPGFLVADKTFAEAYAAYQNGSMLFANWNGNFYRLSGVSSTSLSFTDVSVNDNASVGSSTLTYNSSGAISLSSATVVKYTPLIIPLLCDDSSDYMDPPSGTLSIAYSNDIIDISSESTQREVILVNGYDPYDPYGTYSSDKYSIVSTVFTPGASGDPDTLTIIFRCLGSRNGTSIIKTINLSGEVYSGVIAVSYSEEPAGSGSMPVNAAVIHVNAPLGSAITFFKDSTVMEAVTAAQTHPNADGKTEDYYYSVPTSDFGSWTVAASKSGENDATQSFSVLVAKQYDVILSYLAPYDFQAVEWLQTSTNAYFDTGIIPTTTNYTTKVSLQVAVADGGNIFNVEGGYGMNQVNGYEQLRYNYVSGQTTLNVPGIRTVGTDFDIIYNNDSGVVMINGVEVSAHPNIRALDDRRYSILVSAARYGAAVSYYGTWRYKRFTVLERDTKNVLIDMHPCYRKMDNMPGFWDSVSNTFITQLGTGIITVGPDL